MTEPGNIVEFQTYSQCVDQLISKQVDAVTTDDAILKGYAAKNPKNLKVTAKPFTEEPYGVGLNKDDKVLRDAMNDSLEKHEKDGTYKKIYDATLGLSKAKFVAPPAVERY